MAILHFNETHHGRRMTIGDKGVRTYSKSWQVITDDPATEQLEIKTDGRCPRIGDPYSGGSQFDQFATCRSVTVQQEDNRIEWTIDAEYSTAKSKKDKDDQLEPNPLLQPAKIFWEFNHYSKPVDRAISSNVITSATTDVPIVNAAYDPFDPTPEIDDVRLALRVEKNFSSYDVLLAYDYTNAINQDVFLGGAARTWKIREISNNPGEQTKDIGDPPVTIVYYPVTFIFDYREETWDLRILNAGYRALVTGIGKHACIEGDATSISSTNIGARATRERVGYPWPLSTNGTQLASTDGTGINYLTFQVYKEKQFSALGVP